jgi:hypothetical protein
VDLPALVAEVPLDLTTDARQGIASQPGSCGWIVVVDRLDKADIADLKEVFVLLRAVLETPDAGPHQWAVHVYEHLAGRFPDRVLAGERTNHVEQFGIVALLEVTGRELIASRQSDGRSRLADSCWSSHYRSPPANQLSCTAHLCPPHGFQTSAVNSVRN